MNRKMGHSSAVFGVHFSSATRQSIVHQTCGVERASGMGVRAVLTANLFHIVTLRKNPQFRDAYNNAWQVTIDGAPVYFYVRLRGVGVPERVTGADLFPEIMRRLSSDRHRPFFVAPRESTGVSLKNWLVRHGFAADQVDFVAPPFGFEDDKDYSERLAGRIKKHGTTHLFFGLGIPKSEIWINRHRDAMGDLFAFAFGASLEFFTGEMKRAPVSLQRLGLEWAWRVAQEPRRLFTRYFVYSWAFVPAIIADLRNRGGLLEIDASTGTADVQR